MVSSTIIRAIDDKHTGRMAESHEALVLGTSHLKGVGFSPNPVIILTFLHKVLFP